MILFSYFCFHKKVDSHEKDLEAGNHCQLPGDYLQSYFLLLRFCPHDSFLLVQGHHCGSGDPL